MKLRGVGPDDAVMALRIVECVVGDVVVALRVGAANSRLSDRALNDSTVGSANCAH